MKRFIILVVICFLYCSISGAPVSLSEALSVATNWLQTINPTVSTTPESIIPIVNPSNINQTDWFLVSLQPTGFVLISADDKVIPILGYSLSNNFVVDNIPDNLETFLNEYHTQINIIRNNPDLMLHPDWTAVRSNDYSNFLPNRPVGPLITTNWDQNYPYNYYCPVASGGPGGHVYAGCAATTMAQIMKYWAYPQHGTGSHTYTTSYGTHTADFGNANYIYSSMPNSIWTVNQQICTLIYHCAVSVDMNWGINGSGAQPTAVRNSFINYFNFETTVALAYKAGYNSATWDNMMKDDLDHQRPIFYVGVDPSAGGHAWVCDGYQGANNNYYHMNWGWSGAGNGYYYLTNLNPNPYNFSSNQGMVYRIQPPAAITPPTNLTATVDNNNVFLQWVSPLNRALLGYNIYRNGTLLVNLTDPNNTAYYDINLSPTTYLYYVTAVFTNGESTPSNTASVMILPPPVINFQDGFENYPDFATSFSPWFNYDNDLSLTKGFIDNDFANEGNPMAFTIFNPSAVTPPITNLQPKFGQKMAACFSALNPPNNDWLIGPKWNTGSIRQFHFWAKTADASNGLEQIKVGVSTTTPDPANMTIISGQSPISVPTVWTEYRFTLNDYPFQNVFVGIQCVSNNTFLLLLDGVEMWSNYMDNDDEISPNTEYLKLKAYPNPFSKQITLYWFQKSLSTVLFHVYNTKGQRVKTIVSDRFTPGNHTLEWDGTDDTGSKLPPSIYFCKIQDDLGNSAIKKIILTK